MAARDMGKGDVMPHTHIGFGFQLANQPQWDDFIIRNPDQIAPLPPADIAGIGWSETNWYLITTIHAAVNQMNFYESDAQFDVWNVFTSLGSEGDCEDFVLTKRKLLAKVGFPIEALMPLICRPAKFKVTEKNHMVLLIRTRKADYISDIGDNPVIRWNNYQGQFLSVLVSNKWLMPIT